MRTDFAGYEQEARYFEAGVRQSKQQELQAKLASMVREVFQQQLDHLHAKLLAAFKGDLGGSIMDKTQPFAEAADRSESSHLCSVQQHLWLDPQYDQGADRSAPCQKTRLYTITDRTWQCISDVVK